MKEIILELAMYMGKTYDDILKKSNKPDDVVPRQICAYVLKNITLHTLAYIGYYLGMSDHTVVSYSISHVKDMNDIKDPIFVKYFETLPPRYKALQNVDVSDEVKKTLKLSSIKNPSIKYRSCNYKH